ncbi:MAG: hypothetical protein A3F26_03585 [Candidatus Ryanbacteria bacterium RIFCSPHIGHO2_12_FULL_47_12b]|uniref:DUF4352 domain-containing protein n=3 Tax=Parcubacteria group TaxID=1794811 RepID=A0A1G2H7W1_9BACT|nr:MAG: hypothetical protein UX74_C0034G0008 [Parcubacteria group bacterium GW2011_GWA2_47_10b]KKU76317.1 MAG: hypothetical protein UY02_C0025G0009 [Candidatus Giovannonibacteria bacterium GW2011_GWB1_47_6b]KKU86313.1 MAG: hypothetical protein UY14_C0003G0009 [Parcubacteria group bacterium GW2011_GWA1_47_9]OGZ45185.1 MAG: hypothetical protein A2844_00490 [Candidatus Ryanbacteria bacterium RIFCSPHIGHO2_01_FULL_48_80]OGZ48188.1 MAG: hypothetical protein A3C83_01705 [Candidatus Ryanbacteria bacter
MHGQHEKHSSWHIILCALAVGASVAFYLFGNSASAPAVPQDVKQAVVLFETKEDERGGVTFTITPKNFAQDVPSWDFEVVIDNHTRELSEDMLSVATLIVDGAEPQEPIVWDGDAPTGHHRKGVLKFKPIGPAPKSFELKIQSVEGERSFLWQLK